MQNIIVVEDEVITAMDIQSRLEGMGYNVPAVSMTGEEAIKLADELRPDLMLMDIMLKGDMDGTIAADRISKKHQIPIVFLTAYNDNKTFDRAKKSNPYAYLKKPFDTNELCHAIELALYKNEMITRVANSEKKYRALMQNANLAIIVHDAEGVIYEVNKAAEALLGSERLKLIKSNLKQFVPKNEMEYYDVKLSKLKIENTVEINSGHIIRTNGTVKDVEILSTYVKLDDEDLLYSFIHDVTDKNKLISQTTFDEKLRTMGQLAAGVVHEINNPLASMFLNLELAANLLRTKKNNGLNGEVAELLDLNSQLTAGAERIKRMVKDLRGFARKDDEVRLKNVHEILETSINLAIPYINHHAQIVRNFSDEIPDIMLNAGKLEQVILNLIINACQAFENQEDYEHNIITITTYMKHVSLYIEITDTGKGIPLNHHQAIFEPFFTTKPANIGTGLGLSICKQLVQSLAGDISIKSQSGSGSTFTLKLPVKVKIHQPKSLEDYANEIQCKTILIVDDNSSSIDVINRLLGKANQVVATQSGRHALQIIKDPSYSFDIIISDLSMHDINGIDLYNHLNNKMDELAKRIIFISDGLHNEYTRKFLNSVKNPCLKRPYPLQDLIDTIKSLI